MPPAAHTGGAVVSACRMSSAVLSCGYTEGLNRSLRPSFPVLPAEWLLHPAGVLFCPISVTSVYCLFSPSQNVGVSVYTCERFEDELPPRMLG